MSDLPVREWLTDPERIAEIERTFAGRTKYEGRRLPWDELLLSEAKAQRAEVARLTAQLNAITGQP